MALMGAERAIERGDVYDRQDYRKLAKIIERMAATYERIAQKKDTPIESQEKALQRAEELRNLLAKADTLPQGTPASAKLFILANETPDYAKGVAKTAAKAIEVNAARKQRVIGTGFVSADQSVAKGAIAQLKNDPQRYARLKRFAEKYRAFADATLNYMYEGGRISREQLEAIREDNEFYLAFNRLFDEIAPNRMTQHLGTRGLARAKATVKTFEGSMREIDNPIVSLIMNAATAMYETDRSIALNTMIDPLRTTRGKHQAIIEDLSSTFRLASAGDPQTITVYHNGQKEVWQVPNRRLWEALQETEWGGPVGGPEFYYSPISLMRWCITHNPKFIFWSNPQRDMRAIAINDKHGTTTLDTMKSVSAEEKEAFLLFGGGMGHFGMSRNAYYRHMQRYAHATRGSGDTIVNFPGAMKEGWEGVARHGEYKRRIALQRNAYKHAIEKLGYDEFNANLYATAQARDIHNFTVAGSWVRWINRFAGPFIPSQVYGLNRAIQSAKQNPVKFVGRMALYTLPLTLAQWGSVFMFGDDDDEHELVNMPFWRRYMFWNIRIPGEPFGFKWLMVPRPFELGIMSMFFDSGIASVRGHDRASEGLGWAMFQSLSPADRENLFSFIRPFAESLTNRTFGGGFVVPPHEEGLALELRTGTKDASRMAQVFGNAMSIDPRYIDNVIRNQFGGIGTLVTGASNIGRTDQPGKGTDEVVRALLPADSGPRSPYQYRDVTVAFELAKKSGQQQTPQVKRLTEMIDDWKAASGEERQDLTKAILSYGRAVRANLEIEMETGLAVRAKKLQQEKSSLERTLRDGGKLTQQERARLARLEREWKLILQYRRDLDRTGDFERYSVRVEQALSRAN
ncbi:MAG: hypothetical protein HC898_11195 [Phycisphaerales bacterium]|nr:hypothetical protein [Phycisphaerales bacterium]